MVELYCDTFKCKPEVYIFINNWCNLDIENGLQCTIYQT